jgi:hypothetical protein
MYYNLSTLPTQPLPASNLHRYQGIEPRMHASRCSHLKPGWSSPPRAGDMGMALLTIY